MDASRLLMTFTILLIGIGISRFVVTTMGRAGDAMATLFVPPDQALGWPHGVQEGDEPWGWRGSVTGAPGSGIDSPGGGDGDGGRDDRRVAETREWRDPPSGTFVVPIDRVAPVRLGIRAH